MFSFLSSITKASTKPKPNKVWKFQYCKGMPTYPYLMDGAELTFAMPKIPNSVHYLTRAATPGSRTRITLTIRVDEQPGTTWDFKTNPNNMGTSPCAVRIFLQRKNDNMSAKGKYEFYRWWSNPQRIVLGPGMQTITVPLVPSEFSSVYGKRDLAPFQECLANLGRVGMTFGGGSFFGHGVRTATGGAQFTVLEFQVT